jgi:thiamine-monophosphate kinase
MGRRLGRVDLPLQRMTFGGPGQQARGLIRWIQYPYYYRAMTISEFELIARFFAAQPSRRADVLLGIGDDCALLQVPAGCSLAVTLDLLVAGVHFLPDTDPEGLGHKALAVNLSDLAAMGAEPAWVTLGLSLPQPDEGWLNAFCRGLFALADRYGVQLVGGDTTRGPLTITLQAHGFVPAAQALRRDGARPGDIICVTGTLGDAGLALAQMTGCSDGGLDPSGFLRQRLERPSPRIAQGLDLRGLASAAIDVSDGLAQDLSHILERSKLGARLWVERLPRSPEAVAAADAATGIALALSGGDDYELCFTVPPARLAAVRARAAGWDCRCTEIGVIEAAAGLRCQWENGTPYTLSSQGYDHFRQDSVS